MRDEPDCCHEDYDADILTGRAMCNDCGYAWWQTTEEIEAEIQHQREYDERTRMMESPWFRFKRWCEGWWFMVCRRFKGRPDDIDGIPF